MAASDDSSDQDALAARVAAGARKLDDAARARNGEQDQGLRKLAADRERWLGDVLVSSSWLTDRSTLWMVAAIACGCGVLLYTRQAAWVWFAIPAGVVAAFAALQWLLRPNRARAIAGERAYLARLPFTVVDYEDYFATSITRDERWYLRLRFAHAVANEDLLTKLFGNVASEVVVRVRGEHVDVQMTSKDLFDGRVVNLARARLLFHRVAVELLAPLDAEFPIASVQPYWERAIWHR